MSGRLFAIVGPSGAGKDTLIQGALAARPGLSVVRRVITRPTSAMLRSRWRGAWPITV